MKHYRKVSLLVIFFYEKTKRMFIDTQRKSQQSTRKSESEASFTIDEVNTSGYRKILQFSYSSYSSIQNNEHQVLDMLVQVLHISMTK